MFINDIIRAHISQLAFPVHIKLNLNTFGKFEIIQRAKKHIMPRYIRAMFQSKYNNSRKHLNASTHRHPAIYKYLYVYNKDVRRDKSGMSAGA